MKKLLILMAAAALIVACSKDDNHGKLDPNAMISLRCAKNIAPNNRATEDGHLTAREIAEQAWVMIWLNKTDYPDSKEGLARGFAEGQRDFVNERLLMWGTDIISQIGTWNTNFINGEDVVLQRWFLETGEVITDWGNQILGHEVDKIDTVAYVSNATIRNARTTIRAAYDRGDYDTVYKLFDEAFTFIPITGAEWRELKAKGLN